MLKKIYLTLLISCCSSSIWAQLPSNFPLYQEVVDHVLDYSTCQVELRGGTKWNIIKNPEGYWVTISRYTDDKTFVEENRQLVWSEKTGFIKDILLKGDQEGFSLGLHSLKTKPLPKKWTKVDEYNISRFFGMDNWMQPNIDYYQENPPKTYEDYYSLGRAHSFIGGKSILNYEKRRFLQTEFKLLDSLIFHSKTAIAHFKKVHELNPTYQTIVGGIYTKYCNEIVTLNMRLAFLGLKQKALAVVEGKELYTAATRAFSKNTLESCPKNAILFTYGDNDTYPLLYLQQAKQIRPDVLIINESLLNTKFYIDHLRSPTYYPKSSLQIDLDPSTYQDSNNEYILLEEEAEEEAWSIQQLIQLLETESTTLRTATTPRFVLGSDQKKAITLTSNQRYLVRSALLLLIILEENHNKRPILFNSSYYFSRNNNFVGAIGLRKHLHLNGMVYQFQYEEANRLLLPKKEALRNYKLFTKQLEWPVIKSIEEENAPSFHATMFNYIGLIDALVEYKKFKKAKVILDLWSNAFANTLPLLDVNIQLKFIQCSYLLERNERATILLNDFLSHLIESDLKTTKRSMVVNNILPHIEHLINEYKVTSLSQQWEQVKAHYNQ
ncbi:MAG: hypothetical protein ACRBFS_26300 [Aureispira sp.]